MKPRMGMTHVERQARSRLAKLIHGADWVRGTLILMRHTCGKPRCRCAAGAKHESWYLAYSDRGRRRMVYVPRDWLERVRGWVANWREAGERMETVSRRQLEKLQRREAE